MTQAPGKSTVDAVGGVRDLRRLAAVAQAELEGHLGDPALNAIVATLRIACRVPIAVVNIVTQDRQTYPAEVGIGSACTSVPDGQSFCSEVVEKRALVMVADAACHPAYAENPLVRDGVVRSYAGYPLVDDGYVLGSVSIFDSEARVFSMDELALLAHQARLASAVLSLRRSVRTDPVTGLPNRRSLTDRIDVALARAQRQGDLVAVMYVEIDGGTPVTGRHGNDVRGNDVADGVRAGLARRWREVLRPTDTLARVGDDEFVALCGDLTSPEQAVAIAERLVEALARPVEAGGASVDVAVSIGVVLARDTTRGADELVRAAAAASAPARATSGSAWHVD